MNSYGHKYFMLKYLLSLHLLEHNMQCQAEFLHLKQILFFELGTLND